MLCTQFPRSVARHHSLPHLFSPSSPRASNSRCAGPSGGRCARILLHLHVRTGSRQHHPTMAALALRWQVRCPAFCEDPQNGTVKLFGDLVYSAPSRCNLARKPTGAPDDPCAGLTCSCSSAFCALLQCLSRCTLPRRHRLSWGRRACACAWQGHALLRQCT